MHQKKSLSRRRFLQAASASLIAAPFIPRHVIAAPAKKLRHASFGASGMGWQDLSAMAGHPDWELAAVCDVDLKRLSQVQEKWPDVKVYQDWRELLDKEKDNIDSVNVSVPDHMHAPIGLKAMDLGKHVYGQKPLAQNLYECRQLMLKARDNGVMTQMGIQVSSGMPERTAVELVHSGAIGKIKEVHTFSNKAWGDMGAPPAADKADPIPEGFDWDLWLGPASQRPFIKGYYHPANWRKRRDFGTGTLGDMGCHMFSGWFRSLDLAAPIAVKSTGPAPLNAVNWATNGTVEYTFKGTKYTASDTVKVTWYDGQAQPPEEVRKLVDLTKPGQGSIYVGTDGAMHHGHGGTPTLHPKEKFTGHKFPEIKPRSHWFEFIDCCLNGGGEKPSANFDYAGPLTEAVLLGCLASPFPGETLKWDAAALKITNNEKANALVKRQYRAGWEL